MKRILYICTFLFVCVNANGQKFFISHDDQTIKAHLKSWLTSNGFVYAKEIDSAAYVISIATEKIKAKKVKISFQVENRATGNIESAILSEIVKSPEYQDYLEFADAKLLSALKKIRASIDVSAKVAFRDTLITIPRAKRDEIRYIDIDVSGKSGLEKDSDIFEIKIERVSPETDVLFNKSSWTTAINLTGIAKRLMQLELLVKADTTIKDDREHVFQLSYKKRGDTTFTFAKTLRMKVLAAAPKKNAPAPFPKNDLLLFFGTTLDPNNTASKVNGFSIEAVAPIQISDRTWLRIGGYLHPNFSRDSASQSRRDYYRLNQNPLRVDTSLIGRATSRLDINNKVESIGLFLDLFSPLSNSTQKFTDKTGVRVSPTMHFEWARRVITPQLGFTSIAVDTIVLTSAYSSRLLDQKPTTSNFSPTRSVVTHLYLTGGVIVEASFDNLYLFFQTQTGIRQTFISKGTPVRTKDQRYIPSVGLKMGIMIKKTFNLMVDVQDIFSTDNYLNISFGIPINLTEAVKKLGQ